MISLTCNKPTPLGLLNQFLVFLIHDHINDYVYPELSPMIFLYTGYIEDYVPPITTQFDDL
jgi:hypothetical protein